MNDVPLKRPPIPSFSVPEMSNDDSSCEAEGSVTGDGGGGGLVQEGISKGYFNAANTNDVPDDGSLSSSLSYGSDTSESSDEEEHPLSLQERMIRNKTRNDQFIKALNEKYKSKAPSTLEFSTRENISKKRKSRSNNHVSDVQARGMLYRKRKPETQGQNTPLSLRLKDLFSKYPYRERQIRQLAAILNSSAAASSINTPLPTSYVHSPIFLTGPRGTGKTSIIKDVMANTLVTPQSQNLNNIHSAYIDCKTLEPSSIERLVYDAYKQLRYSMGSSERPKLHRRRQIRASEFPISPKKCSPPRTLLSAAEKTGKELKPIDDKPVKEEPLNHRLQPRRTAKLTNATNNSQQGIQMSKQQRKPKLKAKRKSMTGEEVLIEEDAVETSHSAVVSFGRSLQRYFGSGSQRTAILVLDDGERLLTLSARKKGDNRSNCLAELLLIPKVMRLNLVIVVISRHSLLWGTRLDNMAPPDKSSTTLASSVGAMTIQFPAYKDTNALCKILKTKKMLSAIIPSVETLNTRPFVGKTIDNFLKSLVQFLSDTSIDINDFVRIGRSLWPLYIRPLNEDNAKVTLLSTSMCEKNSPSEEMDVKLLSLLNQNFFMRVGKMSKELLWMRLDSSNSTNYTIVPESQIGSLHLRMPFLRACLLLASFICQNNRSENDKKIFSVHGNGKRQKIRKGSENAAMKDDTAFSFASADKLKSLRPRPFIVERVFSIFVTLVRLNPDSVPRIPGQKASEIPVQFLGTTRLYDDFHSLIDLGFIHPTSFSGDFKGEQINLNACKFWCSLTFHQAMELADNMSVPLSSYLI